MHIIARDSQIFYIELCVKLSEKFEEEVTVSPIKSILTEGNIRRRLRAHTAVLRKHAA